MWPLCHCVAGSHSTVTIRRRSFVYGTDHERLFYRVYRRVADETTRTPVLFFVHGGFWKNKYDIDSNCHQSLRVAFAEKGFAFIDVEYRQRDHSGGGYPGTMDDVFAAYRHVVETLSRTVPLDLDNIAVAGHSAGGQLALWLSKQLWAPHSSLPRPKLVVGIAPCADLVDGVRRRLSDEGDAIQRFMKCDPDPLKKETMDAYHRASPLHLLPLGVPHQLLVSGNRDEDIPADMIRAYFDAATKAEDGEVRLLEMENHDHYDLTDARRPAFARMLAYVQRVLC